MNHNQFKVKIKWRDGNNDNKGKLTVLMSVNSFNQVMRLLGNFETTDKEKPTSKNT